MKKEKKQIKEIKNDEEDKHAVKNISSKQDKPWVGTSQMEQTQFDEEEFKKRKKNEI
ncbi:hypothetical protein [Gabonibacter chumensis]|uniref:hypothetical protein n=1 Tax=Gabonibacter chumensis TaxID=2972474 RepID=UPI0025739EF9|nr:hypothetical protein [Gabonibacter chumensis]MCR9011084.1 hypothetical protein [Gabonibacter chumensis]